MSSQASFWSLTRIAQAGSILILLAALPVYAVLHRWQVLLPAIFWTLAWASLCNYTALRRGEHAWFKSAEMAGYGFYWGASLGLVAIVALLWQ